MAANRTSKVSQHLRRAALLADGAGLTDAQLLQEYLRHREEAALAALVRRHGPMVWGVCRRILSNYHDAEDAFQAAFLVFVRKAASIASPELLANWLYGVALQTALKARATSAKRHRRERQVREMPEPAVRDNDRWSDLQPILDQELSRLPDKYRIAIVLCDLQGKTRKEAARQLGVPEGTLAARLARGRKMLAQRLVRQGVSLSGGILAALLAQNTASASVPSAVVGSTIKAASLLAAGQAATAGGISVHAVALMEGVVKAMLLTKLKIAIPIVLGMGLLGIGWGLCRTRAAAPPSGVSEVASAPRETDARGADAAPLAPEEGNPAKDGPGEKKVGLPKGPAPVQVLARVDKDGKLVVKAEQMVAVGVRRPPLGEDPPPGPRVLIKAPMSRPHDPFEWAYDLKKVRVFDTKGKEIGKKEWAKRLKDETVAVASFGDQPPDLLHLRILREGTLVFVLPLPPPDQMPLPDVKQAVYQEVGPAPVRVLFFRKYCFFPELP